MKPAPFVYLRPATVDSALEMLRATGDSGKLLAGGQSLIPLLNMRLARPGHLIDLNFVPGLDQIEEVDGVLRIGAMVRQRDLELSPLTRAHAPLIVTALSHVSHVQVRHRGTVGGNLAHADPASELPAVMRCLGARFVVRGARGERRVGADEFFVGLFSSAVAPDELLTHIEVPSQGGRATWAFEEFSRRRAWRALAGVAVDLVVEGGTIAQARIALSGVHTTPHRATAAEELLVGCAIDDAKGFRAASEAAVEGLDPSPDPEAPTDYRLALAKEMTRRTIGAAAAA